MDIAVGPPSNSGPVASAPALAPADESASHVFQAAINPVAATAAPADPAKGSDVPQEGATLGDAILSGINGVVSQASEAWQKTTETLSADMSQMSAIDLYRLQGHALVSSTLMELVGKTVSKVEQDVEQLTKGS